MISLEEVLKHIELNPNEYEIARYNDNEFIVKFMFAIDKGIQMWFKSCVDAKTHRYDVQDHRIQFLKHDGSGLLESVVMHNFYGTIPPAFKMVLNKNQNKKRVSFSDSTDDQGKKKQKESAKYVDNEGQIDSWILSQSEYREKLRGNTRHLQSTKVR